MATIELWTFREINWSTEKLVGFKVEAVDGGIGKIDEASNDVGASYIVVDTGPSIFGKKVMLPAGVIGRTTPRRRRCSSPGPQTRSRRARVRCRCLSRRLVPGKLGSYYDRGGASWSDH